MWGMEVQLHPFSNLSLDETEWSASRPVIIAAKCSLDAVAWVPDPIWEFWRTEKSYDIGHCSVKSEVSYCGKISLEEKYRCAPVPTGKTFQDVPQLRETADNTERYI
jgi:hypothetical protein